MYQYRCEILSWLDGDTARVAVDLGFGIWLHETVRVDGINTPEIHSKNAAEKKAGLLSKSHAEVLAPVGAVLGIQTAKAGKDREKFGRWLARITLGDGRDFASAMIAAGQAKEYHGEKRS